MKKYITGERWKRRIRRKQIRALKKLWHIPGCRPYAYLFRRRARQQEITIVAPKYFSFIYNTEEMLHFLQSIREIAKDGYRIFIDLREVEKITPDAFAVFISSMKEQKFGRFSGNVPLDQQCKDLFTQSGMFQIINSGRKLSQEPDRGRIISERKKKVEPEVAVELIDFATQAMLGKKQVCKGVYSTFIECMSNTHNHAALTVGEGTKNWWATVHCSPEESKACFTFVDCGVGIFKSVKLKAIKSAMKRLGFKKNSEVLEDIFHERVASRTGLSYRGKGLPKIFMTLKRGGISNLIVVSNDAYARPGQNQYLPLKRDFHGTVLYWELPISIEKGQKKESQ